MTNKTYKAEYSRALSNPPMDQRFVVIDTETGECIDNAQGYGYKSAKKALSAYGYKARMRKESIKRVEDRRKWKITKNVQGWIEDHQEFVAYLEILHFNIKTGVDEDHEEFDRKFLMRQFRKEGLKNLPFTYNEFLEFWQAE